jgi:hypothetical protein
VWQIGGVIKPKTKRKGDAVQIAHSVMQDVIALSERPRPKPIKKRRTK